jgi:hypothetical protein
MHFPYFVIQIIADSLAEFLAGSCQDYKYSQLDANWINKLAAIVITLLAT